ncbi:MAG: polyprenyl synthetase family protein, partial [Dermatophilaceae bacterium]
LFDKLLGLEDLDEAGVDELRAAISASGAVGRVEAMIQELTASARAALESTTGLTQPGRTALAALIDVSTTRSA